VHRLIVPLLKICLAKSSRWPALLGSALTLTSQANAQTLTIGKPELTIAALQQSQEGDDRSRAIGCLATAIAYEAGYEPIEGQQAVAEVILNRVRHPAFSKSVCGVIYHGSKRRTGCQFSFTCDGSLNRPMSANVMANTRVIATAALDGQNPVRVHGATHYHADYVSPYWAPSLIRIAKIGAHIFYRGAGARNDRRGSVPHRAFGEPLIGQNETSPPLGEAVRGPITPQNSPSASPVFAPWGLAPLAVSGDGN
jgi:hypothetical protein